mgnify:CR=1 FL=1
MPRRNDTDTIIEPLSHTDVETMEKVLSNAAERDVAIEVDGIVYYIPKPISDLIDSLAAQADVFPGNKPIPE